MDESEFQEILISALLGSGHLDLSNIQSFREGMLLTNDEGFTATIEDGREFQITIVRSR